MAGWYAVKRGITSHHLFKGKPERLAVWMWLMDNVAWKDTTHDVKGHTVDVPRGSVCVSERHIATECGIGYQVVRTAIKRFASEHMLNAQPTHGKNLISLCNYEKYQDVSAVDNATPNATLTQPQRNANAQKEQGNKLTREQEKEDTGVSLATSPGPKPFDEVAQAVSAYNATAERTGWPQVQKLTPARRTALRGRLRDAGGATGWEHALSKAEASSFLTGRTSKPFAASFDFITKSTNFTKIMEGNYDDRTGNTATRTGQSSQAGERIDPTLANIARLAGLG